jgi:hypothetical protein
VIRRQQPKSTLPDTAQFSFGVKSPQRQKARECSAAKLQFSQMRRVFSIAARTGIEVPRVPFPILVEVTVPLVTVRNLKIPAAGFRINSPTTS